MEALLKYRNTRGLSRTNRNTDKSFSIDKDKTNARPPHTMIQPKLELTTPGESYEQEADRMADFVMRKAFSGDNGMPQEHTSRTSALPPVISRQTDGFSSGLAIDSATESGINASRGGGQPLPDALRAKMESGFGTDFSGVRLHTDSQAADLSSSLQAKAFTHGNDIFFNSGQYNAQSATGQHLIAHELTHVVQQSGKVAREEENDTETENTVPAKNEKTHFEELKEIAYSENKDDLIKLLIKTVTDEEKYQEKTNFKKLGLDWRKNPVLKDALYAKDSSIVLNLKDDVPEDEERKNYREEILKKIKKRKDIDVARGEDANYTKYHADLGQIMGGDWCDWFVHWGFIKAFNPVAFINNEESKKIQANILQYTMYEKDKMSGSVSTSLGYFKDKAFLNPSFNPDVIDEKYKISFKEEDIEKEINEISNYFQEDEKKQFLQNKDNYHNKIKEIESKEISPDKKKKEILDAKSEYVNGIIKCGAIKSLEEYIKNNKNEFENNSKKKKEIEEQQKKKKYNIQPYDNLQSHLDYLQKELDSYQKMSAFVNKAKNNLMWWTWYKKRYDELLVQQKEFKPEPGDVIFFVGHIGLVVEVKKDTIYTIEGNTSYYKVEREEVFDKSDNNQGGTDSVEANGNGVYFKKYNVNSDKIMGYGRPDYSGLLEYLKNDVFKQDQKMNPPNAPSNAHIY